MTLNIDHHIFLVKSLLKKRLRLQNAHLKPGVGTRLPWELAEQNEAKGNTCN